MYIGESWDEQLQNTSQKVIEYIAANPNKPIDWNWVTKQVVASEPPRVLDVPGHTAFLQKWGGGSRQQLIMDTLDYINMAMPPGRIVSGSFFEKLGALKFAPGELDDMAMVVHGCVMANATCPKDRENVGIAVSEAHVKSLMTTNKTAGLEAGKIIRRAASLIKQPGFESSRHTVLLGEMMVNMALFIFKVEDRFKSLSEISEKFSCSLVGKANASPAATANKPASAADIIEFDTLSNNAGRLTAETSGFSVSGIVEPKKSTSLDEMYEITYINDDGSCGLSRIQPDGSLDASSVTTVKLDDLVAKYKHSRNRIELYEGYTQQ